MVTLPASTVAVGAEAEAFEYVALGDSAAAGIGAGSPAANSSNCYVSGNSGPRVPNSTLAYPKRVAQSLGATLVDKALCGASSNAVRRQQATAVTKATDLVTVQAGSNDFGFAAPLIFCYVWNPPRTGTCNSRINAITTQYRQVLPGNLERLFDRIDARKRDGAQVVVVGYPHVVQAESTLTCFADGAWPDSTHQALRRAANTLNQVLAAKAKAHGYDFVDPSASFNTHESCGDPSWVNGIRPFTRQVESFHPNATGQEALAWLVWQYVKP
ncbi:SGNH/GDSL hydrolase family protein [Streptomyces aurantiacus]|uniref:SGNH/GDSL hydrolase family protein n=1 Tax=Streptomyces aurantiacus TaxID=47760 RepID=UPI001FE84C6F|nr:SGNH/GDSL hydrolase family protein [Streptomyces aurantiacus]